MGDTGVSEFTLVAKLAVPRSFDVATIFGILFRFLVIFPVIRGALVVGGWNELGPSGAFLFPLSIHLFPISPFADVYRA